MTEQAPTTIQATKPVQASETVRASLTVQPPAPVQPSANVTVTPSYQQPMPVQPATPENPYQSIIDQQNAQIAALMQQNQALNAQVTQMVQSGAQFNGQAQQAHLPQVHLGQMTVQPVQEFPPVYAGNDVPLSLSSDVDVSLEGLAAQIGMKEQ